MMTPHGAFHWNELATWDAGKAKAFYADALDWTFEDMPMPDGGTYHVAMSGGQPVGGIFELSSAVAAEGAPEAWIAYISVDDVDARLAKARAGGATVVREPFDVPGVGRIVMLQEPGGAHIGWMTPSEPPQQ